LHLINSSGNKYLLKGRPPGTAYILAHLRLHTRTAKQACKPIYEPIINFFADM